VASRADLLVELLGFAKLALAAFVGPVESRQLGAFEVDEGERAPCAALGCERAGVG
jgi:hypothetical protein